MGFGDPRCYNSDSKVPTPNIDRLAIEGTRFTDAHAAAAWCTPSRYGLLTGRYPWRAPRRLDEGTIEPGRLTLATLLKDQGYATVCIGKWHLGFDGSAETRDFERPLSGGPLSHGFDYFFGMHASLDIPPYYWIENEQCLAAPTEAVAASSTADVTPIQGRFWRAGLQSPGFQHDTVLPTLATRAIRFLRSHRQASPDQPFLLYLPLTAPHTPWLPDAAHRGRSDAGAYGDFVCQVDTVLGQVLQTLDELMLADNTLVIFTSDNGPTWYQQDVARYGHHSAGPLRGMKMDLWEGGHRVPFITRWPGITPGRAVCDELVCLTDLVATCAAMLDVALPAHAAEDSCNLLPLLRGERPDQAVRETLAIEGRVIRHGDWKLIKGNPVGGLARFGIPAPIRPSEPLLLFDLSHDIGETTNLAESHPEKVDELLDILAKEVMTR
jgi:arylsulfatase A-like enzyme